MGFWATYYGPMQLHFFGVMRKMREKMWSASPEECKSFNGAIEYDSETYSKGPAEQTQKEISDWKAGSPYKVVRTASVV